MSLPVLTLKKSVHKDAEVIQLHFKRSFDLPSLLRPAYDIKWSKTMNCWYIPYEKDVTRKLVQLLNNKATIHFAGTGTVSSSPTPQHVCTQAAPQQQLGVLTEEASSKVEEFKFWLSSKRYSQNTIVTYTDAIKIFLRFYSSKPVAEINNDDVIKFNNQYILANHLSASFQNQHVNAIKLFFSSVQQTKLAPELVHRPKKPKVLPNVLSKEEVKAVLNALSNAKHKTMLSLVYSCGLRCGELLALRFEHVDTKRGLLIIKQAKGRKDRIVPLSVKTMNMLRDYLEQCKPKKFLFEGQLSGETYDARSLQKVLKQAVEKAGIKKPVTLHWLRHSYATHLLENGTDLRYIQEILGHSSSRTTEIYTHVSTQCIQKITSPFDYL